jgi:K+ transporter
MRLADQVRLTDADDKEASNGSQPPQAGAVGAPDAAHRALLRRALLATGVVFGDIGTSPLEAFRLNFGLEVGLAPTPGNVLGIAPLVFWSLTLVMSVKYLLLVLRADDDGRQRGARSREPCRWSGRYPGCR